MEKGEEFLSGPEEMGEVEFQGESEVCGGTIDGTTLKGRRHWERRRKFVNDELKRRTIVPLRDLLLNQGGQMKMTIMER